MSRYEEKETLEADVAAFLAMDMDDSADAGPAQIEPPTQPELEAAPEPATRRFQPPSREQGRRAAQATAEALAEASASARSPRPGDVIAQDDEEPSKGSGFFAVDLREWERVCDLDLINAAVVYLIMARGTGGDNRTTFWSTNAVEQRTAISRPRAKATIETLIGNEFVTGGGGSRPRYKILPPPNAPKDYAPDWVWLPNVLIDEGEGAGMGAFAPIERLRMTQNLDAIRLLVALYHAQSLANDGGLDWRRGGMEQTFSRRSYGTIGALNIWGFDEQDDLVRVSQKAPYIGTHFYDKEKNNITASFWRALRTLKTTGMFEVVPHLMDGNTEEAEIIHPLAPWGVGEDCEQQLANRAVSSARLILSPEYLARLDAEAPSIVVPVSVAMPNVAVVGIGRLRYRPRTTATAKWFESMHEQCETWSATYRSYARGKQRIARVA